MNTKIQQFHIQRILFWIFSSLIILAILLYGYFLNTAIGSVVAREGIEAEMSRVNSVIGDLESEYLALKSSITLDIAYSKGFQSITPSNFISRGVFGKGISLNETP